MITEKYQRGEPVFVKRYWKAGISTIMAVIIMTGMCGCNIFSYSSWPPMNSSNNSTESAEKIVDDMTEHLKSKYGDIDFTVISFFRKGFDFSYDIMHAYITGGDKEMDGFWVERFKTDTEITYEDNYFGLLIYDDYQDMVKPIADKYFKSCKIYASFANEFSNAMTGKSSLQDAIDAKEDTWCSLWIEVEAGTFADDADFKASANAFLDEWEKKELESDVRIFYLKDGVYDSIDRNNHYIIFDGDEAFQSEVDKTFLSE